MCVFVLPWSFLFVGILRWRRRRRRKATQKRKGSCSSLLFSSPLNGGPEKKRKKKAPPPLDDDDFNLFNLNLNHDLYIGNNSNKRRTDTRSAILASQFRIPPRERFSRRESGQPGRRRVECMIVAPAGSRPRPWPARCPVPPSRPVPAAAPRRAEGAELGSLRGE